VFRCVHGQRREGYAELDSLGKVLLVQDLELDGC
jgi:hypothetical protein